jgi:kynurenine formamidase
MAEHGGTHLDAPVHFAAGKHAVDRDSVDSLIGAAVVVDVTDASARECGLPGEGVGHRSLRVGARPDSDNAILLIRTGFSEAMARRGGVSWARRSAAPRPCRSCTFQASIPPPRSGCCRTGKVNAVGIDTASIDYGQSTKYETHQLLYAQNIPGLENLTRSIAFRLWVPRSSRCR